MVRTLELLVPKFAKCRIGAKYRRVKKCPLICILQNRGHFWLSAFKRLDHEIKDDALTVVLLDEISWMGRYDDLFADSIKIAWDNMWKKHDRLVLCRLLLRQTGISRQSCHSVDCSSPDFCPQTFSTAKAVANQIPYADVNNRQKILV